jgi:hypothetical protein
MRSECDRRQTADRDGGQQDPAIANNFGGLTGTEAKGIAYDHPVGDDGCREGKRT